MTADRNGDWNEHLHSVQNLVSIFQQYDYISYLWYVFLYLQIMRTLSKEQPEIYEKLYQDIFS